MPSPSPAFANEQMSARNSLFVIIAKSWQFELEVEVPILGDSILIESGKVSDSDGVERDIAHVLGEDVACRRTTSSKFLSVDS